MDFLVYFDFSEIHFLDNEENFINRALYIVNTLLKHVYLVRNIQHIINNTFNPNEYNKDYKTFFLLLLKRAIEKKKFSNKRAHDLANLLRQENIIVNIPSKNNIQIDEPKESKMIEAEQVKKRIAFEARYEELKTAVIPKILLDLEYKKQKRALIFGDNDIETKRIKEDIARTLKRGNFTTQIMYPSIMLQAAMLIKAEISKKIIQAPSSLSIDSISENKKVHNSIKYHSYNVHDNFPKAEWYYYRYELWVRYIVEEKDNTLLNVDGILFCRVGVSTENIEIEYSCGSALNKPPLSFSDRDFIKKTFPLDFSSVIDFVDKNRFEIWGYYVKNETVCKFFKWCNAVSVMVKKRRHKDASSFTTFENKVRRIQQKNQ